MTDLAAIAAAEASRRANRGRGNPALTAQQRRADADEWAEIAAVAARLAARPDAIGIPAAIDPDAWDQIAATTRRVAEVAIRNWFAAGRQPGEAEARAYNLLHLARAFAEAARAPIPTVDNSTGTVVDFDPGPATRAKPA